MIIRLALLLLVGALAVPPVRAAEPCSLRVAWEPYGDYTFRGDDGEPSGIDIEVMRVVGKELDCAVEFPELPWARILIELEQGQIDATTSAARTPERDTFAYFSTPYREANVAIYVRRGEVPRHPLARFEDLVGAQFRLGVIKGYHYGDLVAEVLADPGMAQWVDRSPDYATSIRKLVHGRIDGYLAEDVGVLETEAEALGLLDRLERHPVKVPGEPLHVMMSRAGVAEDLAAAVDAALLQMRDDGRLRAIHCRFRPQDCSGAAAESAAE
jgi:polar amino acid transport system substrate-binding protein